MSLAVQEIFPTLQGEGPFAGSPALFLRLSGCNLRCHFCDTDFESVRWKPSINEIFMQLEDAETHDCNTKLIVITGGEPFRQNIVPLTKMLVTMGYRVQFETAGTLWVPGLEDLLPPTRSLVSIVCSPKTGRVHPMIEKHCRDWKYIVRVGEVSQDDGLPDFSTQSPNVFQPLARPPRSCDTVWLQPCEEYRLLTAAGQQPIYSGSKGTLSWHMASETRGPDDARTKANVDLCVKLCMTHGYRLSYQLHKLLGLR